VKAIHQRLSDLFDHGTVVVLPSEVAATHWRRAALSSGRTVVREDQFISWDRFKEDAFRLSSSRAPANSVVRTIFAESLLRENSADPFLQVIVPPEYADGAGAFSEQVVQALPWLPLAEKLRARPIPRGVEAALDDLGRILSRYRQFLDAHSLYEPRWLHTDARFLGGSYFLVMPTLAFDFDLYASSLASLERFDIEPAFPTMKRYPDARQELQALMVSLAATLDKGEDPENVAVTVGGLDRLMERLRQAARLYSVPVAIRQGVPLSESGPGRFLRAIGECVADGLSVAALKRLVLNRSIPFADYHAAENAVLGGVEAGCLGARGRPDPRWHNLQEADARELVIHLKNTLPGIANASTVRELRGAVMRLLDRVTDREQWSRTDEAVLQRSIEELNSLAVLESDYSITPAQPYRFWINRLSKLLYVPQQPGRGISVYPYRVAAGIAPRHHFIVNAHQAAVAVRESPLAILPEHQRISLGSDAAERDLTAAYLHAYAASGENVSFSSSEVGFDGPALPPGQFVDDGERLVDCVVDWSGDPFVREENGTGDLAAPLPVQLRGAVEYSRTGPRQGSDFTRQVMRHSTTIEAALARQHDRHETGMLSFSANDLELFRSCPFSYLIARGCDVRELEFDVDPDSPREIGSHYHDVLELLFQSIGSDGGRFHAIHRDDYLAEAMRLSDTMISGAHGMVPAAVFAANRPRFERVFAAVIDNDCETIDGHTAVETEKWERHELPDESVVLIGRLDRVTQGRDGGLVLVDYKKRRIPSAAGLAGDEERLNDEADPVAALSSVAAIQLPLYITLLEMNGEHVTAAFYYSLEEPRKLNVYDAEDRDNPALVRVRMDRVRQRVDDLVREAARRVRTGDYRCAQRCDGCVFRGICRARFVVR
jgi:hypothetical protein